MIPLVRDEETETQRSEVTKRVGEAWMASGLTWGPKNRKVVCHTLNPRCKKDRLGVLSDKLTLQKHKTLALKKPTYNSILYLKR